MEEQLLFRRIKRMSKWIELRAPWCFIDKEIELILEAFSLLRPFCEEKKDGFICNLQFGHEGDHKSLNPSGGCIGWRQ